jgi:hypothetical protein
MNAPSHHPVLVFHTFLTPYKSLFTVLLTNHRYAVSKLLEVFAVRELGHLISNSSSTPSHPSVIINCMTPGACKSDFDRESVGLAKFLGYIMASLVARTTEEGSRTLVNALEAGDESHGAYMADCAVREYVALSYAPLSRPVLSCLNYNLCVHSYSLAYLAQVNSF